MRASEIVLIIIGALVFLMVGCFLFFGVFAGLTGIEDVYKDINRLYAHRVLTGIVGLFFLSVGYVAVKLLLKRTSRDEIFVVTGVNGQTSISLYAIEDLLKKTLRKFTGVKRYRLNVRPHNKMLIVKITVTIFAGKPAADVIEEMQTEISRRLKTFIGLKNDMCTVAIRVAKVIEAKKAAVTDESSADAYDNQRA